MSLFRYIKIVIRDEVNALREQFRESKIILVAFLLSLIGIIVYLQPFPDRHVHIGSAYQGGDWFQMAEASAAFLDQEGLDAQVFVTNGAVDNVNRLIDPKDPINATFTYGITLDDAQRKQIVSLGSVSYDPVWVFYRPGRTGNLEDPGQLLKYRVAMGPIGSGSYAIGKKMMALYGVAIEEYANFKPDTFETSAQRFLNQEADVLIMVATARDPIIQNLLQTPGVELLSFKNADGLSKRSNSFEPVRLPAGSVSTYPPIPAKDVSLVATTTSVVVKKDMHPDLQLAFLMAMKHMNRTATNLFFARRDEFPSYDDPAVPLSPVAAKFYDYGPPQTMRFLPFWIAGFVDRAWLLLLGLIAVFYPLSKLNLHIRKLRFIVRERPLYEELLVIDKRISTQQLTEDEKTSIRQQLDNISRHATLHGVPIGQEPLYFDLVKAIDLTRRKL